MILMGPRRDPLLHETVVHSGEPVRGHPLGQCEGCLPDERFNRLMTIKHLPLRHENSNESKEMVLPNQPRAIKSFYSKPFKDCITDLLGDLPEAYVKE